MLVYSHVCIFLAKKALLPNSFKISEKDGLQSCSTVCSLQAINTDREREGERERNAKTF